MKQKIANQLLMNMGSVVSEQDSTMEDFRCWIVVRAVPTDYIDSTTDSILRLKSLSRDKILPNEDRIFVVRKIFARIECVDNDWDFGPDDEIHEFTEIFYAFDDVLEFLAQQNINTDFFSEPWNTDFPL